MISPVLAHNTAKIQKLTDALQVGAQTSGPASATLIELGLAEFDQGFALAAFLHAGFPVVLAFPLSGIVAGSGRQLLDGSELVSGVWLPGIFFFVQVERAGE
jgi:hypothetical protein